MSKHDPLEDAKVESSPKRRRRKEKPAGDPLIGPETASVAPEPAVAPARAPVKRAPSGPPPGCYKVGADKVVSLNGQITTIRKDSIVDPRQYGGADGIKKLQDLGVSLTALD